MLRTEKTILSRIFGIAILSMLFLCLFVCPSTTTDDHAHNIDCHDFCKCNNHEQHNCNLAASHSYKINNRQQNINFNVNLTLLTLISFQQINNQDTSGYSLLRNKLNNHSYAVRHLNTVILRV